jgi:GNAT superfamily N-acetyltransferase
MMTEYPLTKANRIRLARAFRDNARVDLGIDCAIEGQMGKVFTDEAAIPTAFRIEQGPFRYFAGDARSPGGREMIERLEPHTLLMSSPPEWPEVAEEIHREKFISLPRYSFSSRRLSVEHIEHLLSESAFAGRIRKIDGAMARAMREDPEIFLDLSCFDSAEDFVERGCGFFLEEGNEMIGAAWSSLVCSKGIEVSIYVVPAHRTRGVATALACALLKHCLEQKIDPHWDAANPESCTLAEKLGYVYMGSYDAYVLRE